jgi:hypothetical protein
MNEGHLSFGAQALHYFQRDHDSIRRAPIEGPAAWKGSALARSEEWVFRMSAAHVAELQLALDTAHSRGLTLANMRREDFPLPILAATIAGWRQELMQGRGFVLVRGLPVSRWGEEASSIVYWGLGLHLGVPGAQNPAGDLLGHVTDLGEEATQPHVRRYRTAGDIAFHCDLADAVGLLCLHAARRGGASRIVSSVSVYNELLRLRPDLVERLYEPFYLDTRDEQDSDRPPYVLVPPVRHADGVLRTFYHSDYFRSVVRHPEVPRFTPQERELLDLYEAIASSSELYLDMQFEPGDIQLISNHFILHARTAYDDDPDPTRKRHLLRLWLSLHEG